MLWAVLTLAVWRLGIAGVLVLPSPAFAADGPTRPAQHAGRRPPNILYIVADNQPASILSTYGNPDVRTPNLDRLAAQGMRFTHAFAANGMCSPTRATIHTGLMPSQHGVHSYLEDRMLEHWPADWNAIREFRTLPRTLHARGYQTALIGKWHLGQPRTAARLYDHAVSLAVGHTVDFWNNTVFENGAEYPVRDQHVVDFFTDKAVEYLRSYDGTNPFFLMVTYDGPYLLPPTNAGPARNRFYARYAGQALRSFPRTRIHEAILRQAVGLDPGPESSTPVTAGVRMFFDFIRMNADPESMANMASQNAMVDDGVGRLLDELERRGLAASTIVVYTADQGNYYGQQGLWGHSIMTFPASLHDTVMNVPLIVRYPATVAAGTVTDLMVGQYDLMPTVLDLAGYGQVEVADSPGRSFAAQLSGQHLPAWGEAVYFEQEETRGIRTRRYSYWKRLRGMGQPELYDLDKDPEQRRNVYGEATYAAVVRKLDDDLTAFFATHAKPEYDLWKGGAAKGWLTRAFFFKAMYGRDWHVSTEVKPAFVEPAPAASLAPR